MTENGRRLIEDFLPVEELSEVASSEPRTKGHLSTLHLWRARRPLVACRAAVYAAFVPAPATNEEREKESEFLQFLCRWDVSAGMINQAREKIRRAAGDRSPRVLDFFGGGGAIPLEALRLGCESHAMDLNPVAFLIEKATLEYPQRFGSELAKDVSTWAERVMTAVRTATAHLYPEIPVPPGVRENGRVADDQGDWERGNGEVTSLTPFAFLWARTVTCRRDDCQATVPLYGQTWLRKKPSGCVALRPVPEPARKRVRFEVVHRERPQDFDFDPSKGIEGTATTCLCCSTSVPAEYVREFGEKQGYGLQLLCVIVVNPFASGKLYLLDDSWVEEEASRQQVAEARALELERELGVTTLDEVIPPTGNAGLATGTSYLYGIKTFRQAYTPRQRCLLLEFVHQIRLVRTAMRTEGMPADRAEAIATFLGLWFSRVTDRVNSLTRWNNARETVESWTSMKRFAMTWDFPEVNVFGGGSGDCRGALDWVTAFIEREAPSGAPAIISRGSATTLPEDRFPTASFDAVITDPPYYDNESYSELSDAFYIWLKPAIGDLFPEHFASQLTPKRQECVAAAYRQGGKVKAKEAFEGCLAGALAQARRVLRPDGILVLIYAHKTTLGWGTLINALRASRFEVREAWPIETESKSRAAHQGDAALKSSIFLAARPRKGEGVGSFEESVGPRLMEIAKERIDTLRAGGTGIAGADLLMATLGACLRPYTEFARVEFANGEEVSAERFLKEVEGVALDTILEEVFGIPRAGVSAVDRLTRFYVLWRFTYRESAIEAGDAFVFCYPQGIELDGDDGICGAAPALGEKKGKEYRVRTFEERGEDETLGVADGGLAAPLVDVLHRLLWLLENQPSQIPTFLKEAKTNLEQLRLIAQALCGPALKRGESRDLALTAEQSSLAKLTANWRAVIEGAELAATPADRRQRRLELE